MEASSGSTIVDLTPDQFRRLAKMIYLQEVQAIQDIKFTSEPELVEYLRECKKGYEHSLSMLDASDALVVKYQGDNTKEPIAHDMFTYVMKALNTAWQSIRSFSLRLNYLEKISEHSEQIFLDLEALDATNHYKKCGLCRRRSITYKSVNLTNVARLAKEAQLFSEDLLRVNKMYYTLPSTAFSWWIKDSGMSFTDVIAKYQAELGFSGEFEELTISEKLKVYYRIIEASGVGNAKMTVFEAGISVAGMAVLVLTAGMMVWDLCTSHHKVRAAATDGVMILSTVGGNMIGNVVRAALTIELIGLIEVSSITMPIVGFVVGCIAGYVISKIGNYFIDLIFGNGDNIKPYLPLATDGHRCYAAEMPDGVGLARQIVYYS